MSPPVSPAKDLPPKPEGLEPLNSVAMEDMQPKGQQTYNVAPTNRDRSKLDDVGEKFYWDLNSQIIKLLWQVISSPYRMIARVQETIN